jgi:DNA replication protein DnaC
MSELSEGSVTNRNVTLQGEEEPLRSEAALPPPLTGTSAEKAASSEPIPARPQATIEPGGLPPNVERPNVERPTLQTVRGSVARGAGPLEPCLSAGLTELHLPTVRALYEETARRATTEAWSYGRYLLTLVEMETDVRRVQRTQRRLKESRLPPEKSLSTFDQSRLPLKVRQQVATLIEGSFLRRKENILAFGNPGSGKTHLLCALCQELVFRDYRVLYAPSSLLVQELLVAKRDLALPRFLKRLAGYQALLIDDLGYVQQSREEMEVLFTLLAHRYEQGSVLLTSNLPFSQWEQIFKDPMTAAAAIDRLIHHSVILELNLPSYRMETAHRAINGLAAPPVPRSESTGGLEDPTTDRLFPDESPDETL